MKRSEIIQKLKTGIHRANFIKVNGEHRTMDCTLMPEILKDKGVEIVNDRPGIVVVYDLEAKGIRCFKVDSLTEDLK